jgi:nicotinamidase-related amidase
MGRSRSIEGVYRSWRPPLPPLALDAASALVSVGWQAHWVTETRGGAEFQVSLARARARAELVIDTWRGARGRVVHVAALPPVDQAAFAAPDKARELGARGFPAGAEAFLSGCAPRPGEPVLAPMTTNPLLDGTLSRVLRGAGVDEIVLMGVPGHGTVENVARSCHDFGVRCAVVTDAVASWNAVAQDAGFEMLEGVYGRVTDSDAIVAALANARLDRDARPVPGAAAHAPKDSTESLTAARTALICVDVQVGATDPRYGGMSRARALGVEMAEYRDRLPGAIARLAELQSLCRRAGVEVVHVHIESRTADGRDRSGGHKAIGNLRPRGSVEGRIRDEASPRADEIVLSKVASSGFASGELAYLLRNLGKTHVLIAGVVTSGCVASTARDALAEGFHTFVVEDACAAWSDELHAHALSGLREVGARIVAASDVARGLEATAARGG